jgi:hypothetical protein
VGWLPPFARTGELGHVIADKKLKVDPVTDMPINNGIANAWQGGLSFRYGIRYLSSQVNDDGLLDPVNNLTPVVDLSWSSVAGQPNQASMEYLWGIGVNDTAKNWAAGLVMLVPDNSNTGSHLGGIAQCHLYFDDLLPHMLGKPIVEWF